MKPYTTMNLERNKKRAEMLKLTLWFNKQIKHIWEIDKQFHKFCICESDNQIRKLHQDFEMLRDNVIYELQKS